MKSFITEYLDFTKDLESPGSFFIWSALSCVGAALRDNVYLQYGPKPIYPNIFVLLLAPSGIFRKGQPVQICTKLLSNVQNTKIIVGRNSIQAVIQELAMADMDKKTGIQIKGGSCLLSAEELAAFFVSDPQAMTILTDMYECRESYPYNLKGSGKIIVNNLCVSMLAASNEELLRSVYTPQHVYGGLMGRTFFIKPDERRPPNSLLIDINEEPFNGHYDYSGLTSSLREITKIKGQFMIMPDAKQEYVKWYNKLYNSDSHDKTGVLARIHTGVLKVAMILAAGHRYEIVIKKEDIIQAIDYCVKVVPNYEVFSMSTGKAQDSQIGAILFSELLDEKNKGSISRRLFIRNHWTELDQKQFDDLMEKLQTAGLIKIGGSTDIGDVTISLTDLGKERLEHSKKRKQQQKLQDEDVDS